jgi:hypothetical protein
MPKFKITHDVECTVTHEIEAPTQEEANGIAVGLTFALTERLEATVPGLGFGGVGDSTPPEKIAD